MAPETDPLTYLNEAWRLLGDNRPEQALSSSTDPTGLDWSQAATDRAQRPGDLALRDLRNTIWDTVSGQR